MSTATTAKSPHGAKHKAPKEKKEKAHQLKAHQPIANERLKVVVRRLPPNLPSEVFWQSVQPWVSDDTVTWKCYWPGKVGKRLGKDNIPSRAYIAFKNDEILASFSRDYDGHVFRDKTGQEAQAVVEFAPYQKIPTEKKKVDARNATIEKDEDYISFLQSLQSTPVDGEPVSLEALITAAQPRPAPKTTPLLEAIKAEKARVEKESQERMQAPLLKKEAKRKAAQQQESQPHQQSDKPARPSESHKSGKQKAAKPSTPSKGKAPVQKSPQASGSNVSTTPQIAPEAPTPTIAAPSPPRRVGTAILRKHLQAALKGTSVDPNAASGSSPQVKVEKPSSSGKGKGRQGSHPPAPVSPAVVPSILQRPAPVVDASPAASNTPAQSPAVQAPENSGGSTPAVPKPASGRGRRGGRRGRGRGPGSMGGTDSRGGGKPASAV